MKRRGTRTYIREWRRYRGISQELMAERVNMAQGTISRLETGDIAYTQPVLEAISDVLMCTPCDLIMRDPSGPGDIWSIWDRIPEEQKNQAAIILETFVKKTGTK